MFEHSGHHPHHGHGCGCESAGCGRAGGHSGGHFQRRYETKAERIERMEVYLDDLKAEVQGVEEHLSELKTK